MPHAPAVPCRRPGRDSACPKGILKKARVGRQPRWETLSIWQRLLWLAKQRVARLSGFQRVWWQLKRLIEDRPHIEFHNNVTVTEFSRKLDGGGTIPGDGTITTLGLGKPVAVTQLPLAAQPPRGRAPMEERNWLPASKRVQVLRKAMGDNRFFAAWQRHRSATRKEIRNRVESNKVPVDVVYMPTSLVMAQARAAKVAAEVEDHAARPAQRSRLIAEAASPLKRALKRRFQASENVDPNAKRLASPLRSSSRRQCPLLSA